MKFTIVASVLLFSSVTCYAEQAIINNYNSAPQQPQAQNNCNQNNNDDDNNNGKEGMSVVNNGDGSSSDVYSTGTKKPYNVDNSNCNQQPVIQPYVYPNGGPFPPRPMPRGR